MRRREYEVSYEVEGPMALFNRPDAGSTPVSYPVPTASALKGMFEAVARHHGAHIRPVRAEICQPVRFDRYATNYGGPLRKSDQVAKDNNYQLIATVLVDVCYRVYGVAEALGTASDRVNHAHALQELFERRLRRGQCFHTPCLGWREFVPSYFGELRDTSRADESITLTLPSLLHSVFDRPNAGRVRPSFQRDVHVERGVIWYEVPADVD